MMRLASIGECLLDLNAAFVKRLADDDAVESRMIDLGEMPQIRIDETPPDAITDSSVCSIISLRGLDIRAPRTPSREISV